MSLLRPPGAHRSATGAGLLVDVLHREACAVGRHVLDLGTGGAAAAAAARDGAASVTSVVPSWGSFAASRVALARSDPARSGVHVDVLRGDLFTPVADRRFDLVVGRPPGRDGQRAVVDRICAGAADVLTRDGQVLLVHPARCGVQATVDALAEAGFAPVVLARAIVRSPTVRPRHEEFVVVGGIR